MKSLHDQIRELTDMLEDRKVANRMLTTENQRLKKMGADLQVQLLDKPTARGESAALKSMRDMVRAASIPLPDTHTHNHIVLALLTHKTHLFVREE